VEVGLEPTERLYQGESDACKRQIDNLKAKNRDTDYICSWLLGLGSNLSGVSFFPLDFEYSCAPKRVMQTALESRGSNWGASDRAKREPNPISLEGPSRGSREVQSVAYCSSIWQLVAELGGALAQVCAVLC